MADEDHRGLTMTEETSTSYTNIHACCLQYSSRMWWIGTSVFCKGLFYGVVIGLMDKFAHFKL